MVAVLRPSPKNFQYLSLLVLAVQSAGLTLLMRHSRTKGGVQYSSSSVVCAVEVVKTIGCLMIEAILQGWSIRRAVFALASDIRASPHDFGKLAVPAFLYAIQNNLCYIALSNLSALNYQVIYQMKILTTAGFSVLLLGRRLNRGHWASLLLLMVGVLAVQMAGSTEGSPKESTGFGFLVLLVNSFSSGYAGVYFEQISKAAAMPNAKDLQRRRGRSLWIQSVELGILGLFFSLAVAYLGFERGALVEKGFFHGYDWLLLFVIGLQAFGGIIVAIVIRYADNIQKAFATSLSIVLCSAVSVLFQGQPMPPMLLGGTLVVAASVFLYAKASQKAVSKGLPRRANSVIK